MREEWQARADAASAGVRSIWIQTIIGALLAAAALTVALQVVGPLRWGLLAVGIALIAWAGIVGSVGYLRRIDEQERQAALWATHIGLYVYVLLFAAATIAAKFGHAVPGADHITFFAVCAVTIMVFAVKRFR